MVESPKPEGVLSPEKRFSMPHRTKRTTILITTHYIEEARQASVVGLMRNGALLAEENPMKLMESYNLTSLEDVFLKLCMRKGNQVSYMIFGEGPYLGYINMNSEFIQ